ncbi:MAG: class I SAM-dependent methyltransferase [Acidobacteriota bacterium]
MAELDLNEIVREIQAQAEKRRRENPEIEQEIQRQRQFFKHPEQSDSKLMELELNLHQANTSYSPGRLPPITRFASLKKLILRLIRPFSQGQIEFNSAAVRSLNNLNEIVQTLREEQKNATELVRTFNAILYEDERDKLLTRLATLRNEAASYETRKLADTSYHYLTTGTVPAGFDYLDFENRFRGTEAQIRERLSPYVDRFKHNEPVIDLGCGRGEFLELLREAHVEAQGVEIDARMIQRCREKNLPVTGSDIFEYLDGLEDRTVGGLFAGQVIEHLPGPAVIRLIQTAAAKLKIGGVLAVESVNPASLFVFAHSMYLDPTHVRPYHAQTIEFLCRSCGLSRIEVLFASPVEEKWKIPALGGNDGAGVNLAIQKLNSLLYGPQDYAVIAYK